VLDNEIGAPGDPFRHSAGLFLTSYHCFQLSIHHITLQVYRTSVSSLSRGCLINFSVFEVDVTKRRLDKRGKNNFVVHRTAVIPVQ
jgi:hypothetical protein